MDQADLKTYNPAEKELRDQIKAEIDAKVSKKEYKSTYTASKKEDKDAKEEASKKKLLESLPMLKDITVRHVKDFDEVISDPNYWQFAGYAQ